MDNSCKTGIKFKFDCELCYLLSINCLFSDLNLNYFILRNSKPLGNCFSWNINLVLLLLVNLWNCYDAFCGHLDNFWFSILRHVDLNSPWVCDFERELIDWSVGYNACLMEIFEIASCNRVIGVDKIRIEVVDFLDDFLDRLLLSLGIILCFCCVGRIFFSLNCFVFYYCVIQWTYLIWLH